MIGLLEKNLDQIGTSRRAAMKKILQEIFPTGRKRSSQENLGVMNSAHGWLEALAWDRRHQEQFRH